MRDQVATDFASSRLNNRELRKAVAFDREWEEDEPLEEEEGGARRRRTMADGCRIVGV